MSVRAFVTGGAGFVGSNLVDQLLGRGDEVCVLDDLSTGRIENIRNHLGEPGFRFINDSILKASVVQSLVEACDVVFPLAAAVGVRYIVGERLRAISANVAGSEDAVTSAVPPSHNVHMSPISAGG